MHGALLAAVHPDNTPHGYNLTFAFPMLMFIIIAGALFLRFRAAHSVPGHVPLTASRWAGTDEAGGTGTVNLGDATVQAAVQPGLGADTRPDPGSTLVATDEAGPPPATADEQARPAGEGTEER